MSCKQFVVPRAGSGVAGDHDSERRDEAQERLGRHDRHFPPERFRRHLKPASPEDRAKFAEFIKDLRRRMEERGIRPGRWHGRR